MCASYCSNFSPRCAFCSLSCTRNNLKRGRLVLLVLLVLLLLLLLLQLLLLLL